MQQVDVVYFIEHPARELDIACAVKCHAERNYNLDIRIKPFHFGIEETMKKYDPKVVVVPYCYRMTDPGIKNILSNWKNSIIFNLAFEQVYNKVNQSLRAPNDMFAKNNVIHHSWGNFYSDYLQLHGVPREHIVLNGNPSYTLYTHHYRNYFQNREDLAGEFGLDLNSNWVFLPENYGAAFYTEVMINDLISRGYDRKQIYGYHNFALNSLNETINWISDIANENKKLQVIIRPRPATPLQIFKDYWLKKSGDFNSNIKFIKVGTVREWILASDLIVSSYSTTLIESSIALKPTYMLMPLEIPQYLYSEWFDFIPKIRSKEEFMHVLCTLNSSENKQTKLQAWARDRMMNNGDSVLNLAEYLNSICNNNITIPNQYIELKSTVDEKQIYIEKDSNLWIRKLKSILPDTVKKIAKKIVNVDIKSKHENISGLDYFNTHEDDYISQSDIEFRVQKWAKILNTIDDVVDKRN